MEYEIIRSRRRTMAAQIQQNRLVIRAPLYATDQEIHAFVLKHQGWIREHLAEAKRRQEEGNAEEKLTAEELQQLTEKAKEIIPQRAALYAPLVGVTYGRITIRHQKTRWGSCSRKGNLNFNCLLMLAPGEVIDSVVVHELCHRKEMNHSKKFYDEVLRVYPEYRKWDQWLKKNGAILMQRMPEKEARLTARLKP